MMGFTEFLKDNFGNSSTPMTSPLEPRLKAGQNATLPLPVNFDTPVGKRRIPRDKDPKKPNYEMIKDARKGDLSGFLRLGKIFRASDFVGIVNPKTAIITLSDVYDFETRCLISIAEQPTTPPPTSSIVPFKKTADKVADDEKSLRNLFYISLNQDELPSFHFWTKPGELDPVTAAEPFDWGEHFEQNPPSPRTTARIAVLENERTGKVQQGVGGQQAPHTKLPSSLLNLNNNTGVSGSHRGPTQQQSASHNDPILQTSASAKLKQSPFEAEVLLQFNRGGMYLREFTHTALYAMASWLVENEEEYKGVQEEEQDDTDNSQTRTRTEDMFLDVLEPGGNLREEKIVSVSRASNRNFEENIKPLFGKPDSKFRVRSTRYQSSWNLESGFDSGGVGDFKYDLKLVRPNVGYCYFSAKWDIKEEMRSNGKRFAKALEFLFDWKLSGHPNSQRYSLDIPGHGSFELDLASEVLLDANIQDIFAKISGNAAEPDSRPMEIFVRDLVEDDTDSSELPSNNPPGHGNARYENFRDIPSAHQAPSGQVKRGDRESIFNLDKPVPSLKHSDLVGNLITGRYDRKGSTKGTEIRGGPDMPSTYPRVFTVSETDKLRERLRIAEASVEESEGLQERLRIAEEKLSEMRGLKERLKSSEDRARLKSSCPFCSQDWVGVTKQQQQDHLKLHQRSIVHQPAPQKCPHPDCMTWLGEGQEQSTHEAISEHLRGHIEEEHAVDGICEHQSCHTNMYTLTEEQQKEHESFHRDNSKIEDERNQLLALVEDTGTERDRLQQQVKHLQEAANERDRLVESLKDVTEERNSLQEQNSQLTKRLDAASDLNDRMRTKETEPETSVAENPTGPRESEAPSRLQYCNVCLKSVDKISANAKSKHADKCQTSVSEFLNFTLAEAKAERENRKNSGGVIRLQSSKAVEEQAEVPNMGKKRKQKASAEAASRQSQQDAEDAEDEEDTNTIKQPTASKTTGRKALKRKNDTFKPPKEDDTEDEMPESPKKKPKLKANAAKPGKETAPTRRSTRNKDVYVPPEEEEEDEQQGEDKPSSSAKGGKRKRKAAAVTTASKKAKTKK